LTFVDKDVKPNGLCDAAETTMWHWLWRECLCTDQNLNKIWDLLSEDGEIVDMSLKKQVNGD